MAALFMTKRNRAIDEKDMSHVFGRTGAGYEIS